jgi:hypothetical protein
MEPEKQKEIKLETTEHIRVTDSLILFQSLPSMMKSLGKVKARRKKKPSKMLLSG